MESCSECSGRGGVDERTCSICEGSGKTYQKSCPKCRKIGKVKTNKNLEVKVPVRIDTVNKLRLSGKGDMYVVINVVTTTKLTKEQKKLFEQLAKTDLEQDEEFKK